MTDRQFLTWLAARIVNVYHEPSGIDFMGKLLSIAKTLPPSQSTPNMGTDLNMLRGLGKDFQYKA